MMLSILICSLNSRAGMLAALLRNLENQIVSLGAKEKVEVRVSLDSGEMTTGAKRNELLSGAIGDFTVFVDDDDDVASFYVEEILKAIESNPDAIGMSGIMSTNGAFEKKWYISKDNPYIAAFDPQGNEYFLRYNNHISPIRASIAKQFKFPDVSFAEDHNWATQIRDSGLIKTETKIDRHPMYHYKFVSNR